MKRIKRLVSLAMAGALLLGSTLFDAVAGTKVSSKRISASSINASETESDRKRSDAADAGKESNSSKSRERDAADSEETEKKTREKTKESKTKTDEKAEKAEKESDSSDKEVRLTLSISKPGSLSASDGVYRVDPSAVKSLTLSWKCKGDCDSYEVSVSGGVYSATTDKTSAKVSVSGLSAGKYTATVKAIRDGKTVAKEKLSFRIVASDAEVDRQASTEKAKEAQPDEASQAAKTDALVEETQTPENDSSEEKKQPAAEEQSTGEQQTPAEEQPTQEQPATEAEQPAEEQPATEAGQPAEEQPATEAEQPAEEQPAPEAGQRAEEQPAPETEQPAEKQPAPETEQPAEEQPAPELELSAAEDISVEEAQSDAEEQSVEVTPATDESSEAVEETDTSNDAPQVITGSDHPDQAQYAATEQPDVGTGIEITDPAVSEDAALEVGIIPEDPFVVDEQVAIEPLTVPEAASDEALTAEAQPSDGALPERPVDAVSANANDSKKTEETDSAVTLSILGAQGLAIVDGTVHVDPAQAEAVTLVWQFSGICDSYTVSVSGGVYSADTKNTRLSLPVRGLTAGRYTATVAAVRDGKTLSSANVSFCVDDIGSEEAADSGLALTVASPQGLLITDGVYQVDLAQVSELILSWRFGGECEGYAVDVSEGVYSSSTRENTLTLPLAGLKAGTYTASVAARNGNETVALAQLDFAISGESEKQQDEGQKQGEDQKQDDQKQGDQKPQGGGTSKGGGEAKGGSTAKGGENGEAEEGFHITPGEALVASHISGSRDMRLYGAVELTLAEGEPMTLLTLGGTALDIRLSDNGPFTASIEENALSLVPEGSAQAWLLNGQALKTLAISGVETLRLTLNDLTVDFSTTPLLTGPIYGTLRAEGWSSGDYWYAVDADGCRVTVADRTYRLTGEGELA